MRARWALAAASATAYAVGVPFDLWVGYRTDWFADDLASSLAYQPGLLAAFVVGWLLVLRNAGGVIGWLLLGQWAILGASGFATAYAALAYAPATSTDLPGARLAAAFVTHGWPLLFAPLVALALVVPDGRLTSPRWRAVAGLGVGSFSTQLVGGFTSHEQLDPPFEDVPALALLPEQLGPWLQGWPAGDRDRHRLRWWLVRRVPARTGDRSEHKEDPRDNASHHHCPDGRARARRTRPAGGSQPARPGGALHRPEVRHLGPQRHVGARRATSCTTTCGTPRVTASPRRSARAPTGTGRPVTADNSNGDGAVKTYPNVHKDYHDGHRRGAQAAARSRASAAPGRRALPASASTTPPTTSGSTASRVTTR